MKNQHCTLQTRINIWFQGVRVFLGLLMISSSALGQSFSLPAKLAYHDQPVIGPDCFDAFTIPAEKSTPADLETALRDWLAAVDKKTLGLALKGASEPVREHIFKAMSSRAVEMMKEDIEALGRVRGKDVTKAQQEAVAIARTLEAEGKISLRAEKDDDFVA